MEVAEKMIGKHLLTGFTSEEGLICNCVYIMEEVKPVKQFYLGILQNGYSPIICYSNMGGVSFTKIRQNHPESLFKIDLDMIKGLDLFEAMEVAENLGIQK